MYENLDNRQLTELLVGTISANTALLALLFWNVVDEQPGTLPEIVRRLREAAGESTSDVAREMLESFATGLEEGRRQAAPPDHLRLIDGGKTEP